MCYGFFMENILNLLLPSADFRIAFPAALRTAVEIEQYIGAIYETVHDCRQDKGGHHIEQGMLFDEYG